MKELTEKVALARPVAKQRANFAESGVVEWAAFWASFALASAGPRAFRMCIH